MNKTQVTAAPFCRRASAALADIFLIQAFAVLLTIIFPENFQPLNAAQGAVELEHITTLIYNVFLKLSLLFTVSLLYFTSFTSSGGQTPGKKIFGIKVIKESGDRVRPACAVIRYVALLFSLFTVFGALMIFFDRNRQGWHDKWSGTFVINADSETVKFC